MAHKFLACWCGEQLQATKASYYDLSAKGWRLATSEPPVWTVECAEGHLIIEEGGEADIEPEALEVAVRKASSPRGRRRTIDHEIPAAPKNANTEDRSDG